MEATNATNATNAIINAIEATNATVDQLVQQGNELCDDVDSLRAADAAQAEAVAAQALKVEAQTKAIAALDESVTVQAKTIAALDESVTVQVAALDARVAKIEQQINEIARLQNELADSLLRLAEARPADNKAATPDMAALIARIPKPSAVRTRGAQQTVEPAQTVEVVEQPAPVEVAQTVEPTPAPAPAKRNDAAKPAAAKPAAATVRTASHTNNAVETRAYARQYMIENGAKVEQLRDPAAIEATVKSDAFAAWLAERVG